MFGKYDFLAKLDNYKDVGYLVLRLGVGLVFLTHGYTKFQDVSKIASFFGSIGIIYPQFFAWFITLLEMVGGGLLILGVASRYLGFLYACDMLVAVWKAVLPKAGLFNSFGQEFILMMAGLSIFFLGAGKYSIEYMLCGKKHKKKE